MQGPVAVLSHKKRLLEGNLQALTAPELWPYVALCTTEGRVILNEYRALCWSGEEALC